jgi:hypothetical protein
LVVVWYEVAVERAVVVVVKLPRIELPVSLAVLVALEDVVALTVWPWLVDVWRAVEVELAVVVVV